MARRSRTAAAEAEVTTIGDAVDQVVENAQQEAGDTSFNPAEFEQRDAGPAAEEPGAGSHAAAIGKRKFTPPPNPFGFENRLGKGNRVHLLKSEPEDRGENGYWVIRFDEKPNEMEGYSKDNPHPVIAYLKSEGYPWGFDRDGKGGWGKEWGNDPYGADHSEARQVLQKAAEMVGAEVSQGRGVG